MKRLMTKCCGAEMRTERVPYDPYPVDYCEKCEMIDPELEVVEFCEGCNKPAKYCDCP